MIVVKRLIQGTTAGVIKTFCLSASRSTGLTAKGSVAGWPLFGDNFSRDAAIFPINTVQECTLQVGYKNDT